MAVAATPVEMRETAVEIMVASVGNEPFELYWRLTFASSPAANKSEQGVTQFTLVRRGETQH
jgi:hypothetical protein